MKIVLASASPRRRELLREMGLESFEICPSSHEEAPAPGLTPRDTVAYIAEGKAREVLRNYGPDDIIIAADTLVYLDGAPLGKPKDKADAARMLSMLSGREHQVLTGLAVSRGEKLLKYAESTDVRFRPLTQDEIHWYVNSGEPMDKAGAYGIQGLGRLLIEGINGDYFNVVGLPVCRLCLMLRELGVELCASTADKGD
ncbi:MAG: Maf family protein [Oscillospiraceae bacterium]